MLDELTLKYPIGKAAEQQFATSAVNDLAAKQSYLLDIKMCPGLLEHAVQNLDEHQLDTPYRPGGWTVKQVVHHVADSHMNAFARFKLALTEENPVIKPYHEDLWAKLADNDLPVNISLTLLHALHLRWHKLLENIMDEEWNRTVFHPEHNRTMSLWDLLRTYAWHGKHHAAHITSLRERNNW